MRVHFRKTGERRYGVFVERENAPAMMMHPAPGYDVHLPHDLLHFVAEAEWGIDEAVFGQLAAGGDAGTFWPMEQHVANKWAHRGERLKKLGSGRRSELLTDLLHRAWAAQRGRALPDDWDERLRAAGLQDAPRLERVVGELDELAKRWRSLPVGGALTLEWPRAERRSHRRRSKTAV
jgi:hypothetical protein